MFGAYAPGQGYFASGPIGAGTATDRDTLRILLDGALARGRVAGLTIRDILNDAPNTATLTVDGQAPAVGQRLRITIGGRRVLFAGSIQAVDHSFDLQPHQVLWRCQAVDDTLRANARRPFGSWVSTSATTIAQAITPAGFSTDGIAAGLPAVTITFDGGATFIACLTQLATAVGGYAKVEDNVVYLFLTDTTDPPDPIDAAHPFLLDPPITITTDSSQLRTRVYGKGYGETIQADVAAGDTLIPIEDGVMFPSLGGTAIAGRTADGAQSDRITFTAVALQDLGTLVGPGAAPTNAPALALQTGAGVTSGDHAVSVVYVTALGKSLAGPVAAINVGQVAAPTSAPTAGTALAGTGPDEGSHTYSVTFQALGGETPGGPASLAVTTSAAVGLVAAPGACSTNYAPLAAGNLVSTLVYAYRVTFVNATGETTGGSSAPAATPGLPGESPHAMALTATTGGGLTTGATYYYKYSYVCANGYETAIGSNSSSISLGGGTTAVSVQQQVLNPWNDSRVTKFRIYRSKANAAGHPAGSYYLIAERPLDFSIYVDTTADTSLSEIYYVPGTGSPSGPRGTDPGYQNYLTSIPVGPAGVTQRKIYRQPSSGGTFKLVTTISNNTETTYTDNKAEGSLGVDVPSSNTTGTAVQRVPLTAIPLGPAGTTGRRLYRQFNAAGAYKLVTTIANNTATTYTDTTPNSGLGADGPVTNTAIGNQIALTAIPIGAAAVTQREIYMSPAGGGTRRRVLTIADNVTTTGTITMSDATLAGQITEPAADTSGLTQPTGQVNPGATTLPVASAATFRATGGWVALGGGQVVRYTGISGQALTGIPAAGAGAITTTVLYGSQAIPAPMLTGVTGTAAMLKGSSVHLWVQRDDLQAQAEHAARTGGDGVVEYLITDARRGVASLTARCDADLAMFARPIVTVTYATRDLKTRSGKPITVSLAAPAVSTTLTIQEVAITEIGLASGLMPRFSVTASSVRFSLEDTLRQLIVKE